jgi:hypothetical protein
MSERLALEEERVVPLIEKYVIQAEYARGPGLRSRDG